MNIVFIYCVFLLLLLLFYCSQGASGSDSKPGTAGLNDDLSARVQELSLQVDSLRRERDKEAAERSYLALERDKISSFWEIAKKDLEDRQAELRNKDREMEEIEERHQMEIKVVLLGKKRVNKQTNKQRTSE